MTQYTFTSMDFWRRMIPAEKVSVNRKFLYRGMARDGGRTSMAQSVASILWQETLRLDESADFYRYVGDQPHGSRYLSNIFRLMDDYLRQQRQMNRPDWSSTP